MAKPDWWDDAVMKEVDREEAIVLRAIGLPVWCDWAEPYEDGVLWGQAFGLLAVEHRLSKEWGRGKHLFYVKKGEDDA